MSLRRADTTKHHLPLAGTIAAASSFLKEGMASGVPEGDAALSHDSSAPADEGDLLQVGDLAKLAGKTVRAIHLYEELGLLKPHARSKGRYRLFGADSLTRVRWIGKLQDLGVSLSEIQTIVRELEHAPSASGAMSKVREMYRQQLASTRAQVLRLQALEHELAESLRYLETCDVCDPARLVSACSCCDMREASHSPPELIAGFHAI